MIAAGLVTAVFLYVLGTLMNRHERGASEKYWKERWKEYLVDKDGSHYPPGGWK